MSYLGVDGCPAGWFVVRLDRDGGWDLQVAPEFGAVWEGRGDARLVLVDIPIGLRREGEEGRRCDVEARALLGRRGSSVFAAPSRYALDAETYEEANEINRRRTGRGLSRQTWAITGRIREVDRLLRSTPLARGRVREIHPEILFWALNGRSAMEHSKKSKAGFAERLEVLRRHYPQTDDVVNAALKRFRRKDVARDDVLDALAAAVTGVRGAGSLRTLPRLPDRDILGLPMEMVYFDGPPPGSASA